MHTPVPKTTARSLHDYVVVFPRRGGRDGAGTTAVVGAFGDSITDDTLSTLNGDDRWPDVLSRRLHAAYGNRVSVVNAGIGGNRILTPERYPPPQPFGGGPFGAPAPDRDLFGVSGLSGLVLLEGINDISAGASPEAIIAGMKELVSRVRAKGNIKIVGATITPPSPPTATPARLRRISDDRQ